MVNLKYPGTKQVHCKKLYKHLAQNVCIWVTYNTSLQSFALTYKNISITDNQIYLDFSAKLLSLQGSFIQILALAKPVKPSPFVRPKVPFSLLIDAQRQAYFVQNTTLKFVRKSHQFMKVHVGSDEKFSSGLFAPLEFLHSLQVVFDSSL